jgi:hypothetical protein
MIKIFCDCCGKEIDPYTVDDDTDTMLFPTKRVGITPCPNTYGVTEDFLVGFKVIAEIYKPKDLMNNISESEYLGCHICTDCIVEVITQKER